MTTIPNMTDEEREAYQDAEWEWGGAIDRAFRDTGVPRTPLTDALAKDATAMMARAAVGRMRRAKGGEEE